ncbi:MAG: hypothetical protein Q8N89_03510 [Azonexus sp.]|nr:hypothetical protein [Azonexus sp.]
MPRTTQPTTWQQSGKSSPEAAIAISLQIGSALVDAQQRLQIKQVEALHATISENALYYKSALANMASGPTLFAEWAALCQHKAQRYSHLVSDYRKVVVESATEINRLVAESVSSVNPGAFINLVRGVTFFPAFERRAASQVIAFPDRRSQATSAQMAARSGNSGHQRMAQ